MDDDDQGEQAKEAFTLFDKDDDGLITTKELPLFLDFESLENVKKLGGGQYGETYTAALEVSGAKKIDIVCKVAKKGANVEWDELRILRQVPIHPNVLRLVGLCTDWNNGSSVALIVELHRNEDLKKQLNDGAYHNDIPALLKLAFGMASAVMHLHNEYIVHRDIACRNFVVSNEGEAVIINFGLADFLPKTEDGVAPLRLSPDTAIPFRWMPLEVFERNETTKATDVYALGVTFWELLNPRRTPFDQCKSGRSYVTMLREARRAPRRGKFASAPLSGLDEAPAVFKTLINDMCAIDPEDRPDIRKVYRTLQQHAMYQRDDVSADIIDKADQKEAKGDLKFANENNGTVYEYNAYVSGGDTLDNGTEYCTGATYVLMDTTLDTYADTSNEEDDNTIRCASGDNGYVEVGQKTSC